MKKKLIFKTMTFSLMTLMSMGMFTACSCDDDDNNGGSGSEPQPEVFHPISASTRTLLDVTEKNTYDPAEFGEVVGSWPMLSYGGDAAAKLFKTTLKAVAKTRLPQMDALFKELVGTAADDSRQWAVKRYVFTYKSISSATGKDTTLVGSVIFPTNTVGKPHQVDALTLYHHMAYLDNSWLASHSVTSMAMHALHNTAVIEPDGQGADSDLKKLIRNAIRNCGQGDLSALQMADCVLAALEIMRQENVTLSADGYSNNWGTSLGTIAATGFAQYMENDAAPDLQMLFKMRASYIGEGPAKVIHIRGYEDLANTIPAQKFYEGWNPKLPFIMSSCPKDELIKYDELKKYFAQLRTMPDGSIDNKVQWLDLINPPLIEKVVSQIINSKTGGTLGVHLLSAVVTTMAASMVNEPADMEKILKSNNIFVEEEEKE